MNSLRAWAHNLPSKAQNARDAFVLRRPADIQGVVDNATRRESLARKGRLWRVDVTNADRRKDEFLATLSHELRSPLASINYAVRVLDGLKGETADRQSMQALIRRQLNKVTQLVDDLLDVSRITSGKLRIQPERLDLRDVVRNAVETLQSDIIERRLKIVVRVPEAPVWLQADAGRLEQVFVNLIANAVKYTDAGGDISVFLHESGQHAVVRIRDSGIGITAEALPRIFELFKQANETDSRSRSGLGVGLAVVRNLVELHDGTVTAVSGGYGQGSEFIVRLPMEH